MIETITPAGCGTRRRQLAAAALFTGGAVAAAAALGAVLGTLGAAMGHRPAVLLSAAVLAALAGLREAGLLRLPLPQLRRQVPERWRRERPLVVWSTGYGLGLGVGVLTHQTVSTFWVACAAAVAVGDPRLSAPLFGLHGLGRAASVLWAGARRGEPAEAVDVVLQVRPRLVRLNALVLGLCTLLLVAAPVVEAGPLPLGAGSQFDPTASGGVLAYAERVGDGPTTVVVRPPGGAPLRLPGRAPALDGDLLAAVDDAGLRVVRWTTGEELARLPGRVEGVALRGPTVVYTELDGRRRRLWLVDVSRGYRRELTRVPAGQTLARPAFDGERVAWSVVTRRRSTIVLLDLATDVRRVVATSAIALHTAPALGRGRIVWVTRTSGRTLLQTQPVAGGAVSTLTRLRRRDVTFTGTAVSDRAVFVTRSVEGGRARIERIPLP